MNRILSALKLDFMMLKNNMKQVLMLFVIIIVIGWTLGKEYEVFTIIVMFLMASIAGMVFAICERNNSDRLYGSLPLSRLEMIIARYVFALVLGIVAALLSIIMMYFSAYRANVAVDWAACTLPLAGGIVYFAFYVAVCYPIYFRVPYSKAAMFTMLPMILLYVGALLLSKGKRTTAWLVDTLKWFSSIESYIIPMAILIAVVLMFLSLLISFNIRKNKEI